jgi:Double-GTPase 1
MMDRDFVIIGLPASGKTTFLAALWHLVEAEETSCRLRLARWEGDLEYLNSIAEAWRSFVPVPRTSQIGDKDVTIHLVDRETGVQGAAFFPDLAGESFDTQVETRRCRPGFLENVAKGGGVLLFISADSKQDGLSIVELNAQFPDGDGDMIVGNVEEIEPSLENPAGVAEPQYQEAPIAAALPIPSRQPEWQPN